MKHAVRLASPAVVRIVSEVAGQVVCAGCANDGSNLSFPLDGSSYSVELAGSGAFISPDGYVLTADHVVDVKDSSDVQQAFLADAISEYARAANVSSSYAHSIFQSLLNQNKLSVPTQVTTQKVFLSTAYTGQLQNSAQVTSYAITRVVTSSPVDKQDTAIVKVEAKDVPFLLLAPGSSVHVQDTVTAVAYPADADTGDFTALLNPTQSDVNTINGLLSPAVNSGQVSGKKTFSDGTLVYQATSIGNHGSSGGPVIDSQGRIIGFVDAGTSDERVEYLIPSDVVAEYAKEANIGTPSGSFMTQWTKAVNEYDATGPCHYTNASKDFASLQSQYPNFGGGADFAKDAKAKATPGECPASGGAGGLIVAFLVLALLAAAAVAGFLFLRKRNQTPRPVAVGPAGYIMSGPGSYPPGAAPLNPSYGPGPQMSHGYPVPGGQPTSPGTWQQGYAAPTPSFGQQAPQTPQPPYGTPVPQPAPYAGPAQPPVGQMMPMAGNAPQPAPAPLAPAQTPVPGARVCANGHTVTDMTSQFCPHCGAPIVSHP